MFLILLGKVTLSIAPQSSNAPSAISVTIFPLWDFGIIMFVSEQVPMLLTVPFSISRPSEKEFTGMVGIEWG